MNLYNQGKKAFENDVLNDYQWGENVVMKAIGLRRIKYFLFTVI